MALLERGAWNRCPTVEPSAPSPFRARCLRWAALCEVLAQSANTKPLLSARRVLQIRIEEKQMRAAQGNAVTLADVEYIGVAAFQHLNCPFSSIKMDGQKRDGNSSTCSLSVGRMFKDASPREKKKPKNCILLDILRRTKELRYICSERRRQENKCITGSENKTSWVRESRAIEEIQNEDQRTECHGLEVGKASNVVTNGTG